MKITVTRTIYTPTATQGVLTVDGEEWGRTLEDTVRPAGAPKIHGKTAIPAGVYDVQMHDSPRFKKRLPWLKDVPGFKYILLHGGNGPEHTEGCILIARKALRPDWISGSLSEKMASAVQSALFRGEKVTCEVIDTERPAAK